MNKKENKTYEVTLYYHTCVTVVVQAPDEQTAITSAYSKVESPKYEEEILNNLTEDSDPDVEEIWR